MSSLASTEAEAWKLSEILPDLIMSLHLTV